MKLSKKGLILSASMTMLAGLTSAIVANQQGPIHTQEYSPSAVDAVEAKLKHTDRLDTNGFRYDSNDPDAQPEHLQDTIAREISLTAQAIESNEKEAMKLQSFLADPSTAVAKYNKQFKWRVWNKVKNVKQLEDLQTKLEAKVSKERDHLTSMSKMAIELADIERSTYQNSLNNIESSLKAANPVQSYNKNFGFFSQQKISSEEELEDKKSSLESAIAYWNEYIAAVSKLLPASEVSKQAPVGGKSIPKQAPVGGSSAPKQAPVAGKSVPKQAPLGSSSNEKQAEQLMQLTKTLKLLRKR